MEKYYVYGLIDPRMNSIFYIGKGKGKRVFQHLNEKEEIHSNTEKLRIIHEIQKEGHEVGYVIIGENLSEDAALLLERLLIYRIGRKIFDEGHLTNIVPGGKWHKEASLFLKKESIPSLETINNQYSELISILEKYPHTAKEFSGLQCPNNPKDEILYAFNDSGEKDHEFDIDSFIQIFGLGHAIDLISIIKDTSMPVYAWNRVWSKTNFEKLEDVSRIPFEDFDIIDFDFVKKINKSIEKCENITFNCVFPYGKIHCEINITSNSKEIALTYFYSNGNKKHLTNYFDGKLNGKCLCWYPNGQLKEEIEYFQNKHLSKKCYFPSGNIEMIGVFNKEGSEKSVKTWYDNGQLSFENNDDEGTSVSYSETGVVLLKSIRSGDVNKGGNAMIWEYTKDGTVKKESKIYYVNGLMHGYEKSFYDTGELKREVDFTNGHNNKIIKSYKKNGEVTIK